ncbi:MAG: response regulator [Proteobacteria bacterium]|nr:response regulator [Pseudomonadota bacterium]
MLPKALVLVVEDNDDVRNIVTIFLRRNGYAIAEAVDGEAAVNIAPSVEPDLILLDSFLPRLDGIEVLKELRRKKETATIPVVMMSAVLQSRDLLSETERLNVSSFLEKPFQMHSLMEHVERALEIKESPQKARLRPSPPKRSYRRGAERRLQHARKPFVAIGEINDLPVTEILHGIFIGSLTGRLLINVGSTERLVYFQNGLPVYAESSVPEETLGFHLMQRGRISDSQHHATVKEMSESGKYYGESLLKLGYLTSHELFAEIEHHLTEKVISTVGLRDGTYVFEEGDHWKDDVIVARMKTGRILLDGLQRFWDPGDVQSVLKVSDESRTFPLDNSPYLEDQLGLSTQESRILQLVRRGLPVGDITNKIEDRSLVVSTLYALYIMEHLGFVLAAEDLVEAKQSKDASEELQSEHSKKERAKDLLAEYIKYRTSDYFTLLGVAQDATNEEVTNSFRARRERYHPNRLIGIDRGLVHEKIEELYIRVHNAYRTLLSSDARQRYIEQLESKVHGAPVISKNKAREFSVTGGKSEDILCFEKGYTLLRGGYYEKANEMFGMAFEIEPKPRYEAYMAWTAYLIRPAEEKSATRQTLLELKEENGKEVLYPYLLGTMAVRENKIKQAMAFFQKAVQLDPKHIDSARQLRILRMRQKGKETSGLFDILKRK